MGFVTSSYETCDRSQISVLKDWEAEVACPAHWAKPARNQLLLLTRFFHHGCGASASLLFHGHVTRHKRGAWRVILVGGGGRERAERQAWGKGKWKSSSQLPHSPNHLTHKSCPQLQPWYICQLTQSHTSCYETATRPALRVYEQKVESANCKVSRSSGRGKKCGNLAWVCAKGSETKMPWKESPLNSAKDCAKRQNCDCDM